MDKIRQKEGKWGIALGIHPSYSYQPLENFSEALGYIRKMIDEDCLDGLGECGFDYTKGGSIVQQERLVAKMAELAKPDIPFILHVRGRRNDYCGEEAYSQCLDFLKGKLKTNQKIQLHSFSGSQDQVKRWLKVFPSTCFSLSGLSKHSNFDQKQGIRCIPMGNLIFETDSPYLPMRKLEKGNAPGYVGEIIAYVAEIRGQEVETLIQSNWRNSIKFFRLE